jgi:hypothetical protein
VIERYPDLPGDAGEVLEEWAREPARHPRIGDWRRAGYRRGVWPPERPGRTQRAVDAGIRPDTDEDVSAALQGLLDQLGEAGGGVLVLEPGRYALDAPLVIHSSYVVLRGAGSDHTVLHFTHPLVETLGAAPHLGSTGWSWNGGHIFFISRERFRASMDTAWAGVDHREGWLMGDTLTAVAAADRGARRLRVTDTTGIRVGEMVGLEQPLDDETLLRRMAGDIPGASTYDWPTRAATIAGEGRYADFDSFVWPVRVVDIEDGAVILEQPLKLAVDEGARLRALGPTVHDSGVEGLTIENAMLPQTTHNINPGSNGVGFQAVYDCWARDVHVVNADVAFAMTAAKSCQLDGVSAGGRSLHHFVVCRVQSHDNLIENFRLDTFTVPAVAGSYLHGLNVEGFSSGNVYRRGVMHTGTFDSHRQLPFENLRCDITITNTDAVPGGALNGGPYFGARSVNWGVDVTNDNNLAIDISDIAPASLTAGITGLSKPGSILGARIPDFDDPLESERLAFGIDLGSARDLLEVQRVVAPVD